MPPQFTFGDIISICKRLGVTQAKKGSTLWRGVGPNKQYRQTTIHIHGNGVAVSPSTAKAMAQQLGFKDINDMDDFLKNRNRKF